MPLEVKPGDKINLYTRGGQVVFFTVKEPVPASSGESVIAGAGAGVVQELTGLRREVEGLQKALAERDRQIASLNQTAEHMRRVKAEFEDMKTQIAKLLPAPRRPRKAIK